MVPSQDIFPEGITFPDQNVLGASKQPLVSVDVPALNETENLPYVLPRIPLWVHEVLLVDGRSTDNTVEVARRLSQVSLTLSDILTVMPGCFLVPPRMKIPSR